MERKVFVDSLMIIKTLKVMFFLAFTGIIALYTSGCDEILSEDSNSPSNQMQYLSSLHSLTWSPDGSMLAYVFDNILLVRDVNIDKDRQITGTGLYEDPTWSPDSIKLAYSSSSYGTRTDVFVKKADGSDIARKITFNKAADDHPRWSPDGARISFHSFRGKSRDIWIKSADGSGDAVVIAIHRAHDQDAEWSPDSSKLAFESERSGNFDIWVARIDGASPPVQVTFDEAADKNPAWSPDGARIAFQSDRDGEQGIWVKNADGTGDVCDNYS